MAAVAIGATLLGSALQAVGQIRSMQAQSSAASYNAKVAQFNSQVALSQGRAAADMQSQDATRKMGAAIAGYGAAGVQTGTGSPVDVLAQSASAASLDNSMIKYNSYLKSQGFQQQASLDEAQAKYASGSAVLSGTAAILGGLTQAGMMASSYSPNSGTGIPTFD